MIYLDSAANIYRAKNERGRGEVTGEREREFAKRGGREQGEEGVHLKGKVEERLITINRHGRRRATIKKPSAQSSLLNGS